MIRISFAGVVVAMMLGLSFAAPLPKDAARPLYFPTHVGTKWVYFWDWTGGYKDQEYVEVITAAKKTNGVWRVTVGRDDEKTSFVWEVTEDGFALSESYDLPFVRVTSTALKYPSKQGQMWDGPDDTRMTAFGPEKFTFNGNEVEAIRVEERNTKFPGWLRTRWYGKGIGLLKDKAPGITITLKSFTPGKP